MEVASARANPSESVGAGGDGEKFVDEGSNPPLDLVTEGDWASSFDEAFGCVFFVSHIMRSSILGLWMLSSVAVAVDEREYSGWKNRGMTTRKNANGVQDSNRKLGFFILL